MKKIIVDSSAWIEYLRGSLKGRKIAEMIEKEEHEIFTPMSVISEVIEFHIKEELDVESALEAMQRLSVFMVLTMESAVHAARLCVEYRSKKNSFGILDAFVIATAREIGAHLLTFDNDFRGFKETIIPS